MQAISQPLTLILIGVTGDLAQKKILKALYKLHTDKLLPEPFTLIGNARSEFSPQEFAKFVKKAVTPENEQEWQAFTKHLNYVAGDASKPETIEKIKSFHAKLNKCGNHLWYLATLPKLYVDIVQHIHDAGMAKTDCGWTKIMLEKPFGTDLATSHELNQALTNVFDEQQIYRIDHFLAKETVQNILAFRFANGIFEHLWSREYIDHMQVNFMETVGIEGREAFYDGTGAVRDVVQNHLLQMLAVTMMEEPASTSAEDIRHQRTELLHKLRRYQPDNVHQMVRFGQYQAGKINDQPVKGYQEEEGIPQGSKTETAAFLKCFVDNERWQDVPIYIRTGKRLSGNFNEISIQFKPKMGKLFSGNEVAEKANVLTFRVQPNEGVVVRLSVKAPGLEMRLEDVPMQFCYQNEFQIGLIEAYVKLIYDAVTGEQMLFPHAQGIEASWQFIQPILDFQQSDAYQPEPYVSGTWGPFSFDALIEADKRVWIEPSVNVCQLPPTKKETA